MDRGLLLSIYYGLSTVDYGLFLRFGEVPERSSRISRIRTQKDTGSRRK